VWSRVLWRANWAVWNDFCVVFCELMLRPEMARIVRQFAWHSSWRCLSKLDAVVVLLDALVGSEVYVRRFPHPTDQTRAVSLGIVWNQADSAADQGF
jgi:hypothetical protein